MVTAGTKSYAALEERSVPTKPSMSRSDEEEAQLSDPRLLCRSGGPCKGGYPGPPSEFQSLVSRYFGRFPCRCRTFDKTSIACRHFVAYRVAVSRPCC